MLLEMDMHFGNYREKMRVAGEQNICIMHIADDGPKKPAGSGHLVRDVITMQFHHLRLVGSPCGDGDTGTAAKCQICFLLLNHSLKDVLGTWIFVTGVF